MSISNFFAGVISIVSYIAIVIITLAILAAILFTLNMETGGASGIPLALALFLGIPLLVVFWIVLKICTSSKRSLIICAECGNRTKVNWGNSSLVLCKSCSDKY